MYAFGSGHEDVALTLNIDENKSNFRRPDTPPESERERARQPQSQPQHGRSEKSRTSPYPQELCLSVCQSVHIDCPTVWADRKGVPPELCIRLSVKISPPLASVCVCVSVFPNPSSDCKTKFERFPNRLVNFVATAAKPGIIFRVLLGLKTVG